MVEGDSVDLLAEGFGLEDHDFLEPIPHAQQVVGAGAHTRNVIPIQTEADVGVGLLCALPQDPVQLQGRVLVNVDAGPVALLRHRKVLIGGMDSNRANASPIFAEEHASLLGEVVKDCVGDTGGVDDVISIQDFHVVLLEAVEPEALVQRSHQGCDWAVLQLHLLVAFGVKEVDGDLVVNIICTCLRYYLTSSSPAPSSGLMRDSPKSIFFPSSFEIREACILVFV